MREIDLKHLEWDKLLGILKEYLTSKVSEKYLSNVEPIRDEVKLREEIALVEEFMQIADKVPLYPFEDVEESIKKASIKDAVLSLEEILAILKVIKLVKEVRRHIGTHLQQFKHLQNLLKGLHTFSQLESVIDSNIDQRGFVKDSASHELATVRQKIRAVEKEIMNRLENLLARQDASKIFTDKIITIRNGRYVLPVRTTELKKIMGIVHGSSASGYTTYVEPYSIVDLNNQLVVLKDEEQEEVKRVLRRITSYIGEQAHRLLEAFWTLMKVDYLKAVYLFSTKVGAKFPRLGSKVRLVGARHPILAFIKEKVFPVDIVLEERRGLLLTGPNTGGKTVALKTLGLCALMFQCALPIPIEEGELPIFENIFTDIGDEQSIEQNLSTFSSHMVNIAQFLPKVNERTLVLLDELGAGTDPVEGSAIGIGLLEYLKSRKAYVFANTHHTPIKVYALSSDYYRPATVAFDKDSLMPLYSILYDAVGGSMAMEIALRCGIPQEVIDRAKQNLPEGFESYMQARENLEEYVREYEKRLKELEDTKMELERLRAQQEVLLSQLEREKEEIQRKAMQEAMEYLKKLEAEYRELIKTAKERQRVREFLKEKSEELRQKVKEDSFKVGDWVEFMGSVGRVIEVKGDRLQVVINGIKAWVRASDVRRGEPPPPSQESVIFHVKRDLGEINLTGLTVEEALYRLEMFLQEAKRSGVKVVKVIHGTGQLKKTVQELLASSSLVVFHREGYPREGGGGVSIVYLEKG
ncbi:MutS2 family protein [Thermocrinis albus DSM 14484]|uniref:Endonuclease MutS2 n=1 Tax=Thermocrinis albus (strain DSM 14484 / JCM 11386 / HI 11/12) TaxID=638303 RepID=D3SL06_THEAH|nr:endonuclease MutS2 [Thermocrinis albus]ADC89436.1 MutS2 family protein [Thermocrinis albus DSM 14484]